MAQNDFSSLSLSKELLAVTQDLGFEKLTPIQAESLPHLLAGKDLIGQSKTGSGKTAAFALPILEKVKINERQLQALILCPTRELATQVVGEIRKLGRALAGLQVLSLVGGQPGREQAEALANGVHIAVGTPGRVLDLIDRRRMDLESIATVVLDEADKMLDMGFEDEMNAIIRELPRNRQTVLFSATFPDSIKAISKRYQKDPVQVTIVEDVDSGSIEQYVYDSENEHKVGTLMRILQQHPANSTVVFFNTKASVKEVSDLLTEQNVPCGSLHGDLEQRERDTVMTLFRNGSYRILLATDVAARGLDIKNLELVVNFDLPSQPDVYIHRIGRTGRAGEKGVAVSIAHPKDSLKLLEIETATGSKFKRQNLGFKNQHGLGKSLREAPMQTLSISGGRKDKLRPGDILGALTGEAGGLKAEDVGKIEIHDKYSYVAISASMAKTAFERLRAGRIKGQKFQIKII